MAQAPRSLARRLHSISGIVPVGAFFAFHLYTNTAASRGADAYNAAAARLQQLPFAIVLEVALIAVPILFHGIYGLFLMAEEAPGAERPGARARILSIAQRATGVIVFAFILFHLWTARLVQIRDHESLDLFRLMQASLASPWIHAFYVAGILAAAFHLSAGIWTFSQTWGLSRSPRARVSVAVASVVAFTALSVAGLRSLAAFRL
jgi:succinate dehydrogenase / fumarate reductase cytochrome b subunit